MNAEDIKKTINKIVSIQVIKRRVFSRQVSFDEGQLTG